MAFPRPVPVPDVRTAVSRMLGHPVAAGAATAGIVAPTVHPGAGERIEDPMFIANALGLLVLLSLVLSMLPCPGATARARS